MDFRCLPMLFFLNLILMTAHAALPPQFYWQRMLPTTPMPQAIIELLNHGNNKQEFIDLLQEDETIQFIVYKIGQFIVYKIGSAQQARSKDNKPPLFWNYDGKNSEPTLKIHSKDDKPPLFWNYDGKNSEPTLKIHSKDDKPPLFWNYDGKNSEPTQDDKPPLFWNYDGKNSEPTLKIHSKDDKPPLFWNYDGKNSEPTQDDKPPLFWNYDGKNSEPTLKIHLKDDKPPLFWNYDDKNSESHNHELHEHPKENFFFMEEDLYSGSKLYPHFYKTKHKIPLLSRQVTQRIPFSTKKMKEILEIFSVEPGSDIAKEVREAIWRCEVPPFNGEEKYCATSLESLLDFITSKLGNNVRAMSTEVESETKSRKFTVKDGVKKLADENIISCHPMSYPHIVFYCHQILNSIAHFVPLEGEDGTRVKAIAVCHKDTSKWDPNHVAFKVLKINPGDAPVCHFMPRGHLLFAK